MILKCLHVFKSKCQFADLVELLSLLSNLLQFAYYLSNTFLLLETNPSYIMRMHNVSCV